MSRNRTANRVLFGAALLVMLGVWPVIFAKLTAADRPTRPIAVFPHPAFANAATSGPNMIADVAESAVDSVVSIHTRGHADVWGRMPQGGGSGVIVSDDGLVVTNNHVTANMREIHVTTYDGQRYRAKLIGGDADSDLAVLKLQGKPKNLTAMRIGNSDDLRLGEVVLAIGNPFGVLGQTVTMGIVSAKDRGGYIQTDAAINQGNSGGALVNMRGELVGINTMIFSRSGGNDGIGFAIPSNTSEPIVRELLQNGHISKPWLGVTIRDMSPALAEAIGYAITKGVLITDVMPGSPADAAGLRRGDVVVELNGKRTDTTRELLSLINRAGVDTEVDIEAIRGDRRVDVRARLGDKNAPRTQQRMRRRSRGRR